MKRPFSWLTSEWLPLFLAAVCVVLSIIAWSEIEGGGSTVRTANLVLTMGMLVSMLVALSTLRLSRDRREADEIVDQIAQSVDVDTLDRRLLGVVATRTDNPMLIVDADGRIEWINRGVERLLSRSAAELIGRTLAESVIRDEANEEALARLEQRLGNAANAQAELRFDANDGRPQWLAVDFHRLHLDDSADRIFIGSVRDVTDRRLAEEQLVHISTHDVLTDLPNRKVILAELEESVERMRNEQLDDNFALLFIDLDRFKIVNDSLGHIAGDRLLLAIADRLRTCVVSRRKAGDIGKFTIARMGGDEFTILLEGMTDRQAVLDLADRLLDELSEPVDLGDETATTSASIGIAFAHDSYRYAEDVLRDADIAMYQAKEKGKSQFVVFDEAMRESVQAQRQIEEELRVAISEERLDLSYLPIVDLNDGTLAGFEALLRWRHDELGWIAPSRFVKVAEESGLMISLGRWVLREAVLQLNHWHMRFPEIAPNLSMHVNVSTRQLADPSLVARIENLMLSSQIRPGALCLEMRESAVVEDGVAASALLDRLSRLNVKLFLDDFGTGYSSLACLHQYPIHGIKIDRAFIQSMESRRDYSAVVHSILSLSENLGIKTIAVGIETSAQLAQLQSLDCEYGQGYFFSRALPAEAAEDWLASYAESVRRGEGEGWIARAGARPMIDAQNGGMPADDRSGYRAAG